MNKAGDRNTDKQDAMSNLLDPALKVIRAGSYAAISVDDLFREAGVSEGAFFRHFRSKDDLTVAAANHWSEVTGALFHGVAYDEHEDPLDLFLGYINLCCARINGEASNFTCLVGTMVQEVFGEEPDIRAACEASISGHPTTLEADIAEVMRKCGVRSGWTATSLALHTQAALQGAFILAKGKCNPKVAADSIDHLHRYVELLSNAGKQRR